MSVGRKPFLLVMSAICALTASQGLASPKAAPQSAPLVIEKSLIIPGVPTGPYADSPTLDIANSRVFATPQAAKAVAVLDMVDGRLLHSIAGIGNPHSGVYLSQSKRFVIVDGATSEVKFFDGTTYELIKAVKLVPGADMASFNPRTGMFYVNVAGGGAGGENSIVAVIDTDKMEKVAEIAVPGSDVEGSTIDAERQMLYVNLSAASAVAVIDLKTNRLVTTWKLPAGDHSPYAAAVDTARGRIYVACRDDYRGTAVRGSIIALEAGTGRAIATLPVSGWVDGISVDAKRKRIYVSSGFGRIESFAIGAGDKFSRLPAVETALLAKTSLWSPELDRLFVSVPKLGSTEARVMVFKPQP